MKCTNCNGSTSNKVTRLCDSCQSLKIKYAGRRRGVVPTQRTVATDKLEGIIIAAEEALVFLRSEPTSIKE